MTYADLKALNDIDDAFMAGEWCAANRLHDEIHRATYNNWMDQPQPIAQAFKDGYRSRL